MVRTLLISFIFEPPLIYFVLELSTFLTEILHSQVIMGPGIEAGSTFDFIGSNVDVAPTFLALAGVDPTTVTPPMDGKSVASQLIKIGAKDSARVLNKVCCVFCASKRKSEGKMKCESARVCVCVCVQPLETGRSLLRIAKAY